MTQKSTTIKNIKRNVLVQLLIALCLIMLVINPARYSRVSLNGLTTWATILVPSLFPFFVFSTLFSKTGIAQMFSKGASGITKKMFNCPGKSGYVWLISIMSGYPVGAKMVSDLYLSGQIDKGQAFRTTTFTSNSGPMFIIGTVGSGFFCSPKAGYIILISHIVGSIINGLTYRNALKNETTKQQLKHKYEQQNQSINDTLWNSIFPILIIGAFVCLFFIISQIAIDLNIFRPISFILEKFGVKQEVSNGFFSGLLEITKGTKDLSEVSISLFSKSVLSCFLISFGGLATFFQGYVFLEKVGVTKKLYLLQKITHAIYSTMVCAILCLVLL